MKDQPCIKRFKKLPFIYNLLPFFFSASQPQNDLLAEHEDNEAFALTNPGEEYAGYFPDSGENVLDVSDLQGSLELKWLNIDNSTWQNPQQVNNNGNLRLQTPEYSHWAVLVR